MRGWPQQRGAEVRGARAAVIRPKPGFEPRFVWMLTGTPISSSTSDLSFGMVSLLGKPPLVEPFLTAGGEAGEEFRPPPSASLATVLRKLVTRHLKSQRIGGQEALSLPEKEVWGGLHTSTYFPRSGEACLR